MIRRLITRPDVEALIARHRAPCSPALPVRDLSLYQMATLHRSRSASPPPGAEHLVGKSYERLEFLGDAVIGLSAASHLFRELPGSDEGVLSRRRSDAVRGKTLARLARERTSLPEFAQCGRALTDDVAEDMLEAFVGALFVDQGYDASASWFWSLFRAGDVGRR
jgi:ribonuclease-3